MVSLEKKISSAWLSSGHLRSSDVVHKTSSRGGGVIIRGNNLNLCKGVPNVRENRINY